MPKNIFSEIVIAIGVNKSTIAMSIIALLSSSAAYANRIRNGTQKASLLGFFVNMASAVVISYGFDKIWNAAFPDANPDFEKGLMVIIGISAVKILEAVEQKGIDVIIDRVLSVFRR